jgi:hypothetical protein
MIVNKQPSRMGITLKLKFIKFWEKKNPQYIQLRRFPGHAGVLWLPGNSCDPEAFSKVKYPLQFYGAAGDLFDAIPIVCQQGRHKFLFEVNQALFSVTRNSNECSRTPGFAVVFNSAFRDYNRFENFIIPTTTIVVVVVVTAVIISITSTGFTVRCATGEGACAVATRRAMPAMPCSSSVRRLVTSGPSWSPASRTRPP